MRTVLIVLVVAALLAGCATTDTKTPTTTSSTPPTTTSGGAPPVLAYVAKQNGSGATATYAFEGPATAAPGWTTFSLANQGTELHQLVVIKLPMGQTFEQHRSAMMGNASSNDTMGMSMGDAHANATYAGGVAAASPGGTSATTVRLAEGTYVLECDIPGSSGSPHATMGMMKELTVSGADNGAAEPTSDLTVTVKEYQFLFSQNVTAGAHTIKIVNDGTMPHEAPFIHLVGNKTMQDFLAWSASPQGPPPATDAFGGAAMSIGAVQYVNATFVAGGYGMICFLPDEHGAPHFTRGMVTQFVVR